MERSHRWALGRVVLVVATALGGLACGDGGEEERAFEGVALVRHPGGFGGAPASSESTCEPLAHQDVLSANGRSKELSWEVCRFTAPDLYELSQGRRALSEEELDRVEQSLAGLEVGMPEWRCGADAGFLTLDVRRETSTELYISSNDCPAELSAGRTPATGISDLRTTLDEVSR